MGCLGLDETANKETRYTKVLSNWIVLGWTKPNFSWTENAIVDETVDVKSGGFDHLLLISSTLPYKQTNSTV